MNIRHIMLVSSYITIYGVCTVAVLPLSAILCHPAGCHCSFNDGDHLGIARQTSYLLPVSSSPSERCSYAAPHLRTVY